MTLTVESPHGTRNSALEIPEWHLPTFDPKNETKYMYKLHSLEIYFWAKEDALVFVNAVRRMLPIQQVTVLDEPVTPAPHREPMSPVVQKLENVAVTDPSYQHGQTKNSQTSSLPFFAGPPVSTTPPKTEEPVSFAPMAYNPAAPAAPEAIKHREKTPPPEDGAGNPLVAAATADHYGQQPGFPGPPSQHPSQVGYFPQTGVPGPPSNRPPTSSTQSPFAHHFQNQFAAPPTQPTSSSPYAQQPAASPPQSQPGFQQQQQFTSFPLSSTTPSSVSSPGAYSQASPTPQHDPNTYTPPAGQGPPGGYASFNYATAPSSSTKPMQTQYGIHDQIYRPTEIESSIKHNEKPIASTGPKPPQGKLEARASKLEKGVGGLFKKLEKKYG